MSIRVKVNGKYKKMNVNDLLEYNENHDEKGLFASGDGGSSQQLTNQDLAKSGVTAQNYRSYLKKDPTKNKITKAQYVAAKQYEAFNRGEIMSIKTASDYYDSYFKKG